MQLGHNEKGYMTAQEYAWNGVAQMENQWRKDTVRPT